MDIRPGNFDLYCGPLAECKKPLSAQQVVLIKLKKYANPAMFRQVLYCLEALGSRGGGRPTIV